MKKKKKHVVNIDFDIMLDHLFSFARGEDHKMKLSPPPKMGIIIYQKYEYLDHEDFPNY